MAAKEQIQQVLEDLKMRAASRNLVCNKESADVIAELFTVAGALLDQQNLIKKQRNESFDQVADIVLHLNTAETEIEILKSKIISLEATIKLQS